MKELRSILDVLVVCPRCHWSFRVGDCEPDADADGSLGCPRPDCGGIMREVAASSSETGDPHHNEAYDIIGTLLAAYDAQATRLAQVEQENAADIVQLVRQIQEQRDRVESAEQRLAEAEAREHALTAAITALEQEMAVQIEKDRHTRYDDVEDGVWAHQHEAAGAFRSTEKWKAKLALLAAQGHAERNTP